MNQTEVKKSIKAGQTLALHQGFRSQGTLPPNAEEVEPLEVGVPKEMNYGYRSTRAIRGVRVRRPGTDDSLVVEARNLLMPWTMYVERRDRAKREHDVAARARDEQHRRATLLADALGGRAAEGYSGRSWHIRLDLAAADALVAKLAVADPQVAP